MKYLLVVSSIVVMQGYDLVAGDNQKTDLLLNSVPATVDSEACVEPTQEQRLQVLVDQAKRVSQVVDAYKKDAASMDEIRRLLQDMSSEVNKIDPAPITFTDVVTSAMLPWFIIACYAVHQVTS